MNDDERTGVRSRAERKVYQAGAEQLVSRQQASHLANILTSGPVHTTAASVETGSIGQNRRLHRELCGVSKRGYLPHILIILLGECLLSVRITVVVDHSLDVAGGHGA